ncbi:C-GCAxxG-C-C family protein [Desulfobaculum senezii]|jgi:hypothetical protein
MLTDTSLHIMTLTGQGYCCAQIMVKLCLDTMQRDNPDLLRAVSGLCVGGGDCAGTCGILTGGACALSLYAGKGEDTETPDDKQPLLLETFRDWFAARAVERFGGITCGDIAGTDCPTPSPDRCGTLLAEAADEVLRILADNGIDPTLSRDDADAS